MLVEFENLQEKTTDSPKIRKVSKHFDGVNYIDNFGNIITDPDVLAEIKRIEAIPRPDRKKKENLRLNRLLKYGDSAIAKNKLKPTQSTNKDSAKKQAKQSLHDFEKSHTTNATEQLVLQVIDDIYKGLLLVESLKKHNMQAKDFYGFINKEENFTLKQKYKESRQAVAEFMIYKQKQLMNDLLIGNIDSSTYSAISRDLQFMAARFSREYYGDSQPKEVNVTHRAEVALDPEKIASLNKTLANKAMLPSPDLIDCDFDIKEDKEQ